MAKYLPGPMVSAVSGSQGGTVFSKNAYGQYTRMRAIPITSVTEYAIAAKARLTGASQAWQGITAAQRLAWKHWAVNNPVTDKLGMSQVLSGHVAYVGNACRAQVYGTAPLTDPPIAAAPAPLKTLTLTADIGAGDVEIAYTDTPTGANDVLWLEACVTDSPGILWVENLYRFLAASGGAQASPYVFEAHVTSRLGALQVGQYLHVRVRVFSNATYLISAPLTDRVIVISTP